MSVLDVLNREYPGDVAWWKFVDVFRPAWDARSDKLTQVEQFSDAEIAVVLTSALGSEAAAWFNARNNALGGRSPSDVLRNERFGHAIVRSLIMRMPLSPPDGGATGRQVEVMEPKKTAARADRSFASEYVYVEGDGSARELELFEIDYLNTKFNEADGARPYIKNSYVALTPDGRISGFLPRKDLAAGVRVKSALEGTVPVENADQAIAVGKIAISKYVTHVAVDPEALGTFSAKLDAGIWRVMRVPNTSETRTPPPVIVTLPYVVRLSAASGRIVSYGWQ
jgi:hypothetical protein